MARHVLGILTGLVKQQVMILEAHSHNIHIEEVETNHPIVLLETKSNSGPLFITF